MQSRKIYTPEGVQDILTRECRTKRRLEALIRNLFYSFGYDEIETPTLEFYDVYSEEPELIRQETMFKFFDPQGRILVLRPDMTVPAARVAATKLNNSFPARLCYLGNTFHYNELGGGRQKEFTQAGVEIIGESGPESDAEVIATAIYTLLETGLENFQIDIGQVEFFQGLMEQSGLSGEESEKIRALIDKKDYLGVEEMLNPHDIEPSTRELILKLPGLFGSPDILTEVRKQVTNARSLKALENLEQVLEILDDYGLSRYVTIDLGQIHSLNYYTGIIFKGFTYGVGFPILSGGRYDRLMERFGVPQPATGFGLGINMVMMALERQNIAMPEPVIDTLVSYSPSGRKNALQLAGALRRQGLSVEVSLRNSNVEAVKEYARSRKIGGIIRVESEEKIEIFNLETGETTFTTITELLNEK